MSARGCVSCWTQRLACNTLRQCFVSCLLLRVCLPADLGGGGGTCCGIWQAAAKQKCRCWQKQSWRSLARWALATAAPQTTHEARLSPRNKAAAAAQQAPSTFSIPDHHRSLDDILKGEQQVHRRRAHHCLGQTVLQEGCIHSLHPQEPSCELVGLAMGSFALCCSGWQQHIKQPHWQSKALTGACAQERAGQP